MTARVCYHARAMDNRDCKLTITCIQPQESDGDELYVMVTQADGRVTRNPPRKKRFDMDAGDTVSMQSRDAAKVVLHESDLMTPDDQLGEVTLEAGVDAEHTVTNKSARYTVTARWS